MADIPIDGFPLSGTLVMSSLEGNEDPTSPILFDLFHISNALGYTVPM